jgi:hypothetical protein
MIWGYPYFRKPPYVGIIGVMPIGLRGLQVGKLGRL